MLNISASHAVVVMTMMTNQEPPPMKAIVRFSDGKKGQFILNILPDLTAFTSAVMSSEELTGVNFDRVGRIQSMYHN